MMIFHPVHQYQRSTVASYLQIARNVGRGSKEKGRMAHGLDLICQQVWRVADTIDREKQTKQVY